MDKPLFESRDERASERAMPADERRQRVHLAALGGQVERTATPSWQQRAAITGLIVGLAVVTLLVAIGAAELIARLAEWIGATCLS